MKSIILLSLLGLCLLVPPRSEQYSAEIEPRVGQALHSSETIPIWIFLRDKGRVAAADIEELKQSYNPRAVARRMNRRSAPGLFDERDLPLAARYIVAISRNVERVRTRSRWLNAVSADVTAKQLIAIRRMPFVRSIQLVRRSTGIDPHFEKPLRYDEQTPGPGAFYGLSFDQLQTINLPDVHQLGWTGDGIVIGVLDTGFKRTHSAFSHPDNPLNVIAEYDFINDDPNTAPEAGDDPDQHRHGTWILGTMAAYQPGTYVGAAYEAAFVLCKTEDITNEYQAEEDFYVAGLEFIEANGGDVATSSLQYLDWYTQADMDGQTAVTTIAVNAATDNGVHCCTAVGNSGHDSNPSTSRLGAPADAFNVLAVGSVNVFGEISGFSSDGPTADGRTKPEVLAVGEDTVTISSSDDNGYTSLSGTSLSTPLVAAAVACVAQSGDQASVQMMRDAFLFTASEFESNGTFDPLHVLGYGIIDSLAAVESLEPQTAFADSFLTVRGFLSSGDLADTFESDDSYLKFQPGITLNPMEPPVWIEFEGTINDDSPSALSLVLEASANTAGLTQTIEIFNWNSGQYELVDSRAATLSDQAAEIELSEGVADYVQLGSGAIKTRVGWRATGIIFLFPWTVSIDQLAWSFFQ
jgi:hypothetical protein